MTDETTDGRSLCRPGETRSLDELAAGQGVTPIADLDEVFGTASDLWDDNDDFDRFLAATAGDLRWLATGGRIVNPYDETQLPTVEACTVSDCRDHGQHEAPWMCECTRQRMARLLAECDEAVRQSKIRVAQLDELTALFRAMLDAADDEDELAVANALAQIRAAIERRQSTKTTGEKHG